MWVMPVRARNCRRQSEGVSASKNWKAGPYLIAKSGVSPQWPVQTRRSLIAGIRQLVTGSAWINAAGGTHPATRRIASSSVRGQKTGCRSELPRFSLTARFNSRETKRTLLGTVRSRSNATKAGEYAGRSLARRAISTAPIAAR